MKHALIQYQVMILTFSEINVITMINFANHQWVNTGLLTLKEMIVEWNKNEEIYLPDSVRNRTQLLPAPPNSQCRLPLVGDVPAKMTTSTAAPSRTSFRPNNPW